MNKKLIVAYIIEGDNDVFELSYNSIKDVADKIVIIDGNKDIYDYNTDIDTAILHSPYPHNDKGANGKQRNKYIEYLKKHFEGHYCLVLDADEVVDNPKIIKNSIQNMEEFNFDCANIHMRHFIYNLGLEDSTVEKHFVPTRLFKITKDIYYDEAEHVCLKGIKKVYNINDFCIWHLGYSREMFRLLKKYNNHLEKSNIHSNNYLEWWYNAHLFGEYPVKKIDINEIPDIILNHFKVNKDYHYFKNRGIELKHAEMVKQWNDYFNPDNVLDIGCGRGCYLRYWEMCGLDYCNGLEISKHACDNKLCSCDIFNCNILDFKSNTEFDLITCIDVLEHLKYEDIDNVLDIIQISGTRFLFSIPFLGDPNLELDKTHFIKESKEWWINKLKEHGFKIKETPREFYYSHQIIIAEK